MRTMADGLQLFYILPYLLYYLRRIIADTRRDMPCVRKEGLNSAQGAGRIMKMRPAPLILIEFDMVEVLAG